MVEKQKPKIDETAEYASLFGQDTYKRLKKSLKEDFKEFSEYLKLDQTNKEKYDNPKKDYFDTVASSLYKKDNKYYDTKEYAKLVADKLSSVIPSKTEKTRIEYVTFKEPLEVGGQVHKLDFSDEPHHIYGELKKKKRGQK